MLRMALSVVTNVSGSQALSDRCPTAAGAISAGPSRSATRHFAGPVRPWQRAQRPATMGHMLLERESPLASLTEYAAEAGDGDGRLVLLSGEAGAGKSALVERLEQDLPDAQWSWGACDGLFTPRPLGPLFDLAEKLGGELAELCRAHAPRDELFSALLRVLDEPGRLHVVVMEDMHWADEATV